MPKLSIIIPCYNEVKNIPSLVNRLKQIKNDYTEFILVDNGSTDETPKVINHSLLGMEQYLKIVTIHQNIGYGHGIMSGIKEAKGDIIAWTHADLQTDPEDVLNAYSIHFEGGNKFKSILKGKRVGRNIFDTFFTYGMGLLSSLLLKKPLSDINAQPKMFHKSFLEKLTDAPDDFSLDLYLLFQARKNKYEILEYPVTFSKRLYGEAKGGGTLKGKWKLIKRTWAHMNEIKNKNN
jgi:glycosyltransferase involved in cell wall biosynthesis